MGYAWNWNMWMAGNVLSSWTVLGIKKPPLPLARDDGNAELKVSESLQELFGRYSSPGVDGKLHLADLLVYLLHEVNYEINKLVLVHLFCVEVGDEKTYVVTLINTKKDS